jgi:hypothetical protein
MSLADLNDLIDHLVRGYNNLKYFYNNILILSIDCFSAIEFFNYSLSIDPISIFVTFLIFLLK